MDLSEYVTYEMPVTDIVRISLKFEHLYQMAERYAVKPTEQDSRICTLMIMDMLQLLNKPELRGKYFQEFSRFNVYLSKLQKLPDVDKSKLNGLVSKLAVQLDELNKESGKFGSELRKTPFFENLFQLYGSSAPLLSFDSPAYHLWLHYPAEERMRSIRNWLNHFNKIHSIVQVFLDLVRGSGKAATQTAFKGFYQKNADFKGFFHLVQVRIKREIQVFPVVNIGHHGISIRFMMLNLEGKPQQIAHDIEFEMASCIFNV